MKTTDPSKRTLLDSLKNGLIVSCQVQKDDPIYTDDIVVKMAQAAAWAGAAGIRANSPEQIAAIRAAVKLPIIGLHKIWMDGTDVFITPTLDAAVNVYNAGAEIVALDCTAQLTAEGRPAYELLPRVKAALPDAIIFADISNIEEARRAVDLGADIIAPTLYGYTAATKQIEEPNMREFAAMCRELGEEAYVMMEGHIYTPEDAMKCLYLGAHAVVVGSAITRPHLTAKRFVDLLGGYRDNWRDAERKRH